MRRTRRAISRSACRSRDSRQAVAELPQDDQPAADLDDRVQTEPDECDRTGDKAGGDRDDRLDDVVGTEAPRKQLRAPAQLRCRRDRVLDVRRRVDVACSPCRPPRRGSGTAARRRPWRPAARSAASNTLRQRRRGGSPRTSTPGPRSRPDQAAVAQACEVLGDRRLREPTCAVRLDDPVSPRRRWRGSPA